MVCSFVTLSHVATFPIRCKFLFVVRPAAWRQVGAFKDLGFLRDPPGDNGGRRRRVCLGGQRANGNADPRAEPRPAMAAMDK
jgi:hypothetical protein